MTVENKTQVLRQQLLSQLGEDSRQAALRALEAILTEENTDALIEILMDMLPLPFWMKWLPIGSVLDRLLPETLLNLFEKLLAPSPFD